MWSNVISIDKCYEREIGYIFAKLNEMNNLSFAVEETPTRLFVYLASACDNQDEVENALYELMDVVFLSFLKMRFFLDRMSVPVCALTHSKCALICSLVHFDIDFESNVLHKVLSDSLDFNVDGLLNFRLRALTDAWGELCDVALRLVDVSMNDDELFDVASFITGTDGNKNKIVVRDGEIKNLTKRNKVEIVKVFDESEYNLLSAIIKEKPCEIEVENVSLTSGMKSTLRHLARVIER